MISYKGRDGYIDIYIFPQYKTSITSKSIDIKFIFMQSYIYIYIIDHAHTQTNIFFFL